MVKKRYAGIGFFSLAFFRNFSIDLEGIKDLEKVKKGKKEQTDSLVFQKEEEEEKILKEEQWRCCCGRTGGRWAKGVQACIESPNDVSLRSTRDGLLAELSAIVFNNEHESALTSVGHSM